LRRLRRRTGPPARFVHKMPSVLAAMPMLAAPLRPDEVRLDVGNFESYSRAFVRSMLTDERHGEGLRAWAAKLLSHLDDPSSPDPDLPADP